MNAREYDREWNYKYRDIESVWDLGRGKKDILGWVKKTIENILRPASFYNI